MPAKKIAVKKAPAKAVKKAVVAKKPAPKKSAPVKKPASKPTKKITKPVVKKPEPKVVKKTKELKKVQKVKVSAIKEKPIKEKAVKEKKPAKAKKEPKAPKEKKERKAKKPKLPINDTVKHVRELILWVEDKLNKEILAAKMEDTKRKRQLEKNELMRFYRTNAMDLKNIFDIQNGIVEAKNMVIKKLQQLKQVTGTFLRTDNGFKVTAPEGFVAVDKLKGNALKLIDRLEFAHANFNVAKAWDK